LNTGGTKSNAIKAKLVAFLHILFAQMLI